MSKTACARGAESQARMTAALVGNSIIVTV